MEPNKGLRGKTARGGKNEKNKRSHEAVGSDQAKGKTIRWKTEGPKKPFILQRNLEIASIFDPKAGWTRKIRMIMPRVGTNLIFLVVGNEKIEGGRGERWWERKKLYSVSFCRGRSIGHTLLGTSLGERFPGQTPRSRGSSRTPSSGQERRRIPASRERRGDGGRDSIKKRLQHSVTAFYD